MNVKVVLVLGYPRSGTSALCKQFVDAGYVVPYPDHIDGEEYTRYESVWASRPTTKRERDLFVDRVTSGAFGDKVVLKANGVHSIKTWLDLFPDARVMLSVRPILLHLYGLRKRYWHDFDSGRHLFKTARMYARLSIVTLKIVSFHLRVLSIYGRRIEPVTFLSRDLHAVIQDAAQCQQAGEIQQ